MTEIKTKEGENKLWPPNISRELDKDETKVGNVENGFRKLRKTMLATKDRSFMWLYLHGLNYTNKNYYRFGHRENNKCHWCGEVQTWDHLFWECHKTQAMWERVSIKLGRKISRQEARWGGSHQGEDTWIFNLAIYLHRSNFKQTEPEWSEFVAFLKQKRETEQEIAKKWGPKAKAKNTAKWNLLTL